MGAAAVLETAAETPPTRNQLVLMIVKALGDSSLLAGWLFNGVERTQEVNNESL